MPGAYVTIVCVCVLTVGSNHKYKINQDVMVGRSPFNYNLFYHTWIWFPKILSGKEFGSQISLLGILHKLNTFDLSLFFNVIFIVVNISDKKKIVYEIKITKTQVQLAQLRVSSFLCNFPNISVISKLIHICNCSLILSFRSVCLYVEEQQKNSSQIRSKLR